MLHVHINTARRWSNRGILRSCRIGPRRDRRFRREDIVELLAELRASWDRVMASGEPLGVRLRRQLAGGATGGVARDETPLAGVCQFDRRSTSSVLQTGPPIISPPFLSSASCLTRYRKLGMSETPILASLRIVTRAPECHT